MYIRFVVDEIDTSSGVELGIFQSMFGLWRAGELAPHEEAWWAEIRVWFNVKLREPDRLSRSRRSGAIAPQRARDAEGIVLRVSTVLSAHSAKRHFRARSSQAGKRARRARLLGTRAAANPR